MCLLHYLSVLFGLIPGGSSPWGAPLVSSVAWYLVMSLFCFALRLSVISLFNFRCKNCFITSNNVSGDYISCHFDLICMCNLLIFEYECPKGSINISDVHCLCASVQQWWLQKTSLIWVWDFCCWINWNCYKDKQLIYHELLDYSFVTVNVCYVGYFN